MFRSENTIISQYQFCAKKYLANASIASEQTEVGVVTKPLSGYVVFMLDYLNFAIETEIDNETVGLTLDYSIINT